MYFLWCRFVLWFDGWMSCLRSYSHEELSVIGAKPYWGKL